MSDYRSDRYERSDRFERARAEPQPGLADTIELGVRRVVTGLVIAGALIGLGAFAGGDEIEAPRYQVATTADGRVIRLNTRSGTLVSCRQDRCVIIQRGSRGLDEEDEERRERERGDGPQEPQQPLPQPEAPKALPAPQAGSAPQAPPAPQEPAAPQPAPRPAAPAN